MKRKTLKHSRHHPRRASRNLDVWERAWVANWSKAGTTGYELPKEGDAGAEAAFLTETRSPEKEAERLGRITSEFVRGFQGLYDLGPAVTVFGSARFKENHPYYKLARSVGTELAHAGTLALSWSCQVDSGPLTNFSKPRRSSSAKKLVPSRLF